MISRSSLYVIAAVVGAAASQTAAGAEASFSAELVDGKRVEGEAVTDWHSADASPRLGDTAVFDESNPMRWLRNDSLAPSGPEAFVELVGGDRLAGVVSGYRYGDELPFVSLPPHLLVESGFKLHDSRQGSRPIRVLSRLVRRIVLRGSGVGGYRPATLILRDGVHRNYDRLRWINEGVEVLDDKGTTSVPLSEIAELHLPRVDPWDAHFEQLAVLAPNGKARLMQLETVDGLRVTCSGHRFTASGNAGSPQSWVHLVQPIWSLDPFSLAHSRIRLRRFYAPHEVPLSNIRPSRSRQVSLFRGGWVWQSNRNVRGGPLSVAGNPFTWGFGVLAYNELEFPLTKSVKSFRVRVGLDDGVGAGGCARAKIFVNRAQGEPLYTSPLLIGSDRVFDTGELPLKGPDGRQTHLLLVADPAEDDHPPDADPWNIRDQLNWLEPMLQIDPQILLEEIRRRQARPIMAWKGWTLDSDGGPPLITSSWVQTDRDYYRFVLQVLPQGKSLSLRRKLHVPEGKHWLALNVRRMAPESTASKLTVEIDGDEVQFDVPDRQTWGEPNPLVVPLEKYAGRQIEVRVTHLPGASPAPLEWNLLAMVDRDPHEILRPAMVDTVRLEEAWSYRVRLSWTCKEVDPAVNQFLVSRGAKNGFELGEESARWNVGLTSTAQVDENPIDGKTAWYAVQTVDVFSRVSKPRYLKVDVPANKPPPNDLSVCPLPVSEGIVVAWAGEIEGDVAEWELHRGSGESGPLKKIATFNDRNVKQYFDRYLEKGKYRYTFKLRDKAGLVSQHNREYPIATSSVVRRINFGGPTLDAPAGVTWQGYQEANRYSTCFVSPNPVKSAGCLEPLYRSERWSHGNFQCHYKVRPGKYLLVVHLAEMNPLFSDPGQRTFDISVNDVVLHKNVDVVAKVGAQTALQLRGIVDVDKDQLVVQFSKGAAGPSVKALEIYRMPE